MAGTGWIISSRSRRPQRRRSKAPAARRREVAERLWHSSQAILSPSSSAKEALAKRGKAGYTEIYYESFELRCGELLKEHCDRLLKQAEAKVEKLTFAADGSPKGAEQLDPQG